ncbi:MAG: DUF3408 domain-containing protein [Mariniphaga sp.]|nr:DUF3408 domain-containing protein [Mariniphaga sp.]
MANENETKPGIEREDYIKRLIAGNYATSKKEAKEEPVSQSESAPEEEQVPIEASSEKPKELTKRKHNVAPDYKEAFLQKKEIKTRQCVYISQQVHDVISKIVRVIADKEISVGGYIDSVLLKHLDEHRDEINDLYRKQINNLI